MKLRIQENNYLVEDIEAVKQYYPDLMPFGNDDLFMYLIALDPTYKQGSNSLGRYGKWILNLYRKNYFNEEEGKEITSVLSQFNTYKNRLTNKDINSYKTLNDLSDAVASVIDDDSMLSDRQKLRFRKNVKAGRISVAAEDNYDTVFENSNFVVYVPNTHEASMKLGKGTNWCTAHENPDWYNKYTSDNGKLYIVKNKKNGYRWQYCDKTQDFLDENDCDFEIEDLLSADEELRQFFYKLSGVDKFDGVLAYTGQKISGFIKPFIKTLEIDNNTEVIKAYAFSECYNLTSVSIPNSVKKIGANAFYECKSLVSVKLPDSLEMIASNCFKNCESLESIKIPNSVKKIGSSAFFGCTSLTSFKIPNGVTTIQSNAFGYCINLKQIYIPDSVTDIGTSVFSNCASLASIVIPDSVTSINKYAFEHCENLSSVKLSNNLSTINDGTFSFCKNLKSIVIPDSVTNIEPEAFESCDNLTVYANTQYIKSFCRDNNISYKPISELKTESMRPSIKEDTCCIPSKTPYIGGPAPDKNGIHYFGKKPDPPTNWRDWDKKLSIKETD